MQFIDLAAQQRRIRETIETNVNAVLNHGRYIMGPEVGELETALAEFAGVNYAVSCASGTDALLLALMAYDVGPGDAIFTTPFTFIATAEVVSLLGATPVFVDIDPQTFNLDPEKLAMAISALEASDAERHPLPNRTGLTAKGIIAVDLFGLPADYQRINAIAKQHGLFVIEDAAQSFGAEYFDKRSCSLADVACTSFFPAKPLGGYGDGGMCFTDDQALADILKSLRIHGKGGHKYDNVRIGVNGRLDTLQAAILKAKFDIFPDEIALRQAAADRYNAMLSPGGSDKPAFQLPEIPARHRSVWAQYSLLAKDGKHRSDLQEKLKAGGVPTAVYYPLPLHLQTAFEHLNHSEGSFPISEDYSKRIFSLPMHPYLRPEDQQRIADIILS